MPDLRNTTFDAHRNMNCYLYRVRRKNWDSTATLSAISVSETAKECKNVHRQTAV